jgi:hypothetical protein
LFRVGEKVSHAALYRCTTCGTMIPLNAGEEVPPCPSRCADAIWTLFNERDSAPPVETREVIETFPGLDLDGEPVPIPVGARLTNVRLGPGGSGQPDDPKLAAFNYSGSVYFGSAAELLKKSKLVSQ